MTTRILKVFVLMMSLALLFSPVQAVAKEKGNGNTQNQCISPEAVKLRDDMRKLWINHTIWTRSYIVSALANLEDKDKVLARLLRNQEDVGTLIKPYYGDAAGTKLTELLKEHILLAGKVVDAAKSGNQANLKKGSADWNKNADDIAQFLSSANPNWTKAQIKEMMDKHLKLITDLTEAKIKKDWDADIAATDTNENHMIEFADVLSEGIIKQFPKQF